MTDGRTSGVWRLDMKQLDRAARLAMRGAGRTGRNPLVGCVIADAGGSVIAGAWHNREGGPHAEAAALAIARKRNPDAARGGTAWVTLEPCSHHGRTPPCHAALLDAGIARVVYGQQDPNPTAAGGAAALQAAGVRVVHCPDHAGSRLVSLPFLRLTQSGRPVVIAKWAQTLDGHVATRSGHSQWISSKPSRRMVHRWRSMVDAILTGIGTIKADDPRLTVRGVAARRPHEGAVRVVVDARLETPTSARILASAAESPIIIACGEQVVEQERARVQSLRDRGAEILPIPVTDNGRLDLRHLMAELAQRSIQTVLTEAGPRLLGGLLAANLVDACATFIAPKILADGDAYSAVSGVESTSMSAAMRLAPLVVRRRADDLLVISVVSSRLNRAVGESPE